MVPVGEMLYTSVANAQNWVDPVIVPAIRAFVPFKLWIQPTFEDAPSLSPPEYWANSGLAQQNVLMMTNMIRANFKEYEVVLVTRVPF